MPKIETWSLEKMSVLECMGETCASSRACCHTKMVNDWGKTEIESQCPSHSSQPVIWERISAGTSTGITLFLLICSRRIQTGVCSCLIMMHDAGGAQNPIKKLASLSCHKLARYLKRLNSHILLGKPLEVKLGSCTGNAKRTPFVKWVSYVASP